APGHGQGARRDASLVRATAGSRLRGDAHPRARGGAFGPRLLLAAGGRWLPAWSVLPQYATPRAPPALRVGGPRVSRVDPRASPPDRHRPGADGDPRIPAPYGRDRIRRGLGPLYRAPGRRDGPLQLRPRSPGHPRL